MIQKPIPNDPELLKAELERQNDRLLRLTQEFRNFAYVVSHDLKEPLRMVNNSVQLLEKLCADVLDPKARECIRYATEATRRMYQLLDDLLAYSRAVHGEQEPEMISIEGLLREVIAASKTTINESGATLTQGALPIVRGVKAQLFQLFFHLIGNAIKYRSERPLVIYLEAKKVGDEYRFSVADNGVGIDPKHFDRIFGIFQRLTPKHEGSGNGIGLAICKTVLERHGGKIWVESAIGQGATFFFTLPDSAETDS